MDIKKGQVVTMKAEYLEAGEIALPHVAIEDAFRGSVRVEVSGHFPGLTFKPINDWRLDWIETVTDPAE